MDYVRQIRDRLPELYALHPRLQALRHEETRVFGITHRSLASLLDQVAALEPDLAPPVSVRLHGDLNTNNVVVDAQHDRVHFIDVHRSGPGDYLQDIGVLLVSSVRTPLPDVRLGAEVARLNRLIHGFAAEFGRLVSDEHFEVRLMLARARSFITSGRIVTDAELARDIYLQGVWLLERAAVAAAA